MTGRTKAEVRDKLRELHQEVDSGLKTSHSYTVDDALDDSLAQDLDGVSARTVVLYRGTITPMLREQFGTVRLRELTAGDVQAALTALASRYPHGRSRFAQRAGPSDPPRRARWLVARNVATLVKPPRGSGPGGRRSRSPWSRRSPFWMRPKTPGWRPTSPCRCSRGCGPRKRGRCAGSRRGWVDRRIGDRSPRPVSTTASSRYSYGAPSAREATPRRRSPAGH